MRGIKDTTTSQNENMAALMQRVIELEAAVATRDAELISLRAKHIKVQTRLHARTLGLWGQVTDYKNYLGQALSRAERAEARAKQAGLD